jgi:hypothetical protein
MCKVGKGVDVFSIVASRVPAGWSICGGLQTEHQDGTTECSRSEGCLGADELHAAWRLCFNGEDAASPSDCVTCGPHTALT